MSHSKQCTYKLIQCHFHVNRHAQDKTVLSCPWCGQNWRQVRTVLVVLTACDAFRDWTKQFGNFLSPTVLIFANFVHTTDKTRLDSVVLSVSLEQTVHYTNTKYCSKFTEVNSKNFRVTVNYLNKSSLEPMVLDTSNYNSERHRCAGYQLQ